MSPLGLVLVVVAVAVLALALVALSGDESDDRRTLQATGQAERRADPDLAVLRLWVVAAVLPAAVTAAVTVTFEIE